MPPMLMQHDVDPRDEIYARVKMKNGQIPGFELLGNRVLVGIYMRPEKTKSGIFLGEQTRAEDRHQGKAMVVLAKGPSAFVSDAHFDFHDQKLDVGDWCMVFVSTGISCSVNGQPCRVVRDQDIAMRIPAPDLVY